MALKDSINKKWSENSKVEESSEFKLNSLEDKMKDIKDSLDKKTISFKEKVNKLANLYSEMKTSDYRYNQKENGDLKSFWFLKAMLDKTDTSDIIAVTGRLAVILHKYFKANNVNHTYIGRVSDRLSLNMTDKVDLTNKTVFREITSKEPERLVVFCHSASFWKYIRVNNLKDKLYMFKWYKDPNMDNIGVFRLNPNYLKKNSKYNKLDEKGIMTWSEYLKFKVEQSSKPSKFDIWQFGKYAAYNTTA